MKWLAVDYGDSRTGLAGCDAGETITSPITPQIEEKSMNKVAAAVTAVAQARGAEALVLSLIHICFGHCRGYRTQRKGACPQPQYARPRRWPPFPKNLKQKAGQQDCPTEKHKTPRGRLQPIKTYRYRQVGALPGRSRSLLPPRAGGLRSSQGQRAP